MLLKGLIKGRLIRRYKRFLADVEVNGKVITAHCPNSGSMKSLKEPGSIVYVTKAENENRKLKYTLQLIETKNGIACVNTNLPNKIVFDALYSNKIPELKFHKIQREVKYGEENSRVDILLFGKKKTFVEVKNVTLEEPEIPGVAQFPDAVTTRGQKHLRELANEVKNGSDAIIFLLVNRTDCNRFKIAEHIDKDYKNEFDKAIKNGVRALVYKSDIRIEGEDATITLGEKIKF